MLLDATPKLEDLIVELLADCASATALSIQNMLLKGAHEFTIQAIYKALRVLEASGVVVKAKKKYSLRLSWVIDLSRIAKLATTNHARHAHASLPKPDKRTIWHFNDLLVLNNFWSQILLLMIQSSAEKQLFTWMPHPWFHLAYSEQEEQYIRSLRTSDISLYLINGGQTFLDKWAEKYWQDDNVEYSSSPNWFHKEASEKYINVFGDYILTVKLDSNIASEIENFYQRIDSFDNLDFSEVFRIFGLRVRAKMWLENNPAKAKMYKTKFIKYFGIKKSFA